MPADAPSTQSLRIAAVYTICSAVWILCSDQIAGYYFTDRDSLTMASTLKGWFFVVSTAAMLFFLVRRQLTKVGETTLAKRRAEEAVHRNEERFRSLAALSPDIISIFNKDGQLVFNSSAAFKIHGYRDVDMIGRNTFELIHPDDAASVQTAFVKCVQDPTADTIVRYRYRNADGSYIWMEASARNELANPHIQGIITISRDISQRVITEQNLRKSDERFQRLVASISDILFATDLKANFTFIAPQVSQFGYTPEELTGHSILNFIHPEDRGMVAAKFQKAMNFGHMAGAEFRILTKDGATAWVQENSGFILSEAGAKAGVSGMLRNITERKNAEADRLRMQDQLIRAQKMEAIGQLAGGVAHDFNNILTVLSMNLASLKEEELPAHVREVCHELDDATNRAASLTRQLLLFARRQVVQKHPLKLDALLSGLLSMLRRLIGENISVEFHGTPQPVWVHADAGMLEQVVMNLVVNARDAMPQGGRLTLAISIEKLDTPGSGDSGHSNRRAGTFVRVDLSDTGCGIDKDTQQRIFEPFFTTKAPGRGTGLGLATVFGILQQHEGWIEVESQPGKGSTFRFYLPETKAGPTEPVHAPHTLHGGRESILVTEDDAGVRQLCVNTLKQLGYQVVMANHGKDALAQWGDHKGAFDLLLTDMIMPEGLSGLDLAELLRKEKPDLKVIVMSGYSLELSQHAGLEANHITYLGKPFNPPSLAKTLRQVLDAPAPGAKS